MWLVMAVPVDGRAETSHQEAFLGKEVSTNAIKGVTHEGMGCPRGMNAFRGDSCGYRPLSPTRNI